MRVQAANSNLLCGQQPESHQLDATSGKRSAKPRRALREDHSQRSASTGSRAAARRAGQYPARIPTPIEATSPAVIAQRGGLAENGPGRSECVEPSVQSGVTCSVSSFCRRRFFPQSAGIAGVVVAVLLGLLDLIRRCSNSSSWEAKSRWSRKGVACRCSFFARAVIISIRSLPHQTPV